MLGAAKWCRSSPPRRRVRRTARRDIEIGNELRHFLHEPCKTALAPSGKTCFALLFDGPAHFVAASKSVDFGTMLGQLRKDVRKIFQLLCDNMDDAGFLLH